MDENSIHITSSVDCTITHIIKYYLIIHEIGMVDKQC